MGVAAEYRDRETANHIKRMSHYSALLARGLGWRDEAVEILFWSSFMHDVGKLGIPDRILQKPSALSPEERKIMENHTVIGANILQDSQAMVLKTSAIVALTHHEKFDGTGYPRMLKGEEIPIEGRISHLADVFDALSSRRVYKPAMPEPEILKILKEGRGSFFDPQIVDVFLNHFEEARNIRDRYADREEDFEKFRSLNARKD